MGSKFFIYESRRSRIRIRQYGLSQGLFGFIGLAAILLFYRSLFSFRGKLPAVLQLGVINSGLPFLMYCIAARWLPAGYSAVFNATAPMMGALIGAVFFKETLTIKKLSGIVLGLVGIIIISSLGSTDSMHNLLKGTLACLVATGCYGLAGFLTKRWITEQGGLDPRTVAFGSQAGATLFLLPFFGWTFASEPQIDWLQPYAWGSIIAVGLLCTAVAYILYFKLIADIGPLKTLTVTFLIPPFACLWGYLALGEKIGEGFIVGACAICFAVWLIASPDRRIKK